METVGWPLQDKQAGKASEASPLFRIGFDRDLGFQLEAMEGDADCSRVRLDPFLTAVGSQQ